MYIIVAGGGILGRSLIKNLVQKHDVVVIDNDQRTCQRIYSQYGVITINGNATRIETLNEAGIDKCDIALAVMRYDSDNLAFSLLANDLGVNKILVRMREPEYKSAYKLAGATNIGSSTDMIVNRFLIDIEQPDIRKVASIGGGEAEISIVTIPEKARCSGKTISEITKDPSFPKDCVIAGIFDQQENRLIIPRGNKKILKNNQVFLVASRDNIEKAARYLMKT